MKFGWHAVFFSLFWAGVSPAFAQSGGVRIDRAIAVVNDVVLSESELRMEARVALVLREGPEVASSDLPDDFLRGFLLYAIQARLISGARQRLSREESKSTQSSPWAEFSKRFSSEVALDAFLRRFGIRKPWLLAGLRRNVANGVFVEERMRRRLRKEERMNASAYSKELNVLLADLWERSSIRVLSADGQLEDVATRDAMLDPWATSSPP